MKYACLPFTPYGKNAQNKGISSYRFAFNGKERVDEVYGDANAYDFGARVYDPRIGRWLAVDPRSYKYPQYSPYLAFGDNPIYWIDPGGETLRVAMNENHATALEDIRSWVKQPEVRAAIQLADDGTVYIDYESLAAQKIIIIGSDPGYYLVDQLIQSDKNYRYQIASTTLEEGKYGVQTVDMTKDANGVNNASTTARAVDYKGQKPGTSSVKPVGVDGEVTITPGKTWTENGKPKSRASVTFHEMWENYERTENKLPYDQQIFSPTGYRQYSTAGGTIDFAWDPSLNIDSAHDRAIMAEMGGLMATNSEGETTTLYKFHDSSNNPGQVDP